MKIKTREHVDGYKGQKAFDKITPVPGTYDAVIVKMQWQKVGRKATEKLRLITHVLKVVETKDEAGSRKMVGGTFGQDIWWNLTKDDGHTLNYNGQSLVNQALACGYDGEFDPENRPSLVPILTGTPFRIKIDVKEDEGEKETYYNVDVRERKHLSKEARDAYKKGPDWNKVVPTKMEDRLLEDADYSVKDGGERGGRGRGRKFDSDAGGGQESGQEADPFTAEGAQTAGEAPAEGAGFIDDDLPF